MVADMLGLIGVALEAKAMRHLLGAAGHLAWGIKALCDALSIRSTPLCDSMRPTESYAL